MRLLISDLPDGADIGYIVECIHRVTSADVKIQQLIDVEHEKNNSIDDLVDTILKWWTRHEYDVEMTDGEEYNVYDNEPKIVEIAKRLRDTRRS